VPHQKAEKAKSFFAFFISIRSLKASFGSLLFAGLPSVILSKGCLIKS
jgi:hypothetical protein